MKIITAINSAIPPNIAAAIKTLKWNKDQINKAIQNNKKQMEAAVKELDFITAARLRDEINDLKNLIAEK